VLSGECVRENATTLHTALFGFHRAEMQLNKRKFQGKLQNVLDYVEYLQGFSIVMRMPSHIAILTMSKQQPRL